MGLTRLVRCLLPLLLPLLSSSTDSASLWEHGCGIGGPGHAAEEAKQCSNLGLFSCTARILSPLSGTGGIGANSAPCAAAVVHPDALEAMERLLVARAVLGQYDLAIALAAHLAQVPRTFPAFRRAHGGGAALKGIADLSWSAYFNIRRLEGIRGREGVATNGTEATTNSARAYRRREEWKARHGLSQHLMGLGFTELAAAQLDLVERRRVDGGDAGDEDDGDDDGDESSEVLNVGQRIARGMWLAPVYDSMGALALRRGRARRALTTLASDLRLRALTKMTKHTNENVNVNKNTDLDLDSDPSVADLRRFLNHPLEMFARALPLKPWFHAPYHGTNDLAASEALHTILAAVHPPLLALRHAPPLPRPLPRSPRQVARQDAKKGKQDARRGRRIQRSARKGPALSKVLRVGFVSSYHAKPKSSVNKFWADLIVRLHGWEEGAITTREGTIRDESRKGTKEDHRARGGDSGVHDRSDASRDALLNMRRPFDVLVFSVAPPPGSSPSQYNDAADAKKVWAERLNGQTSATKGRAKGDGETAPRHGETHRSSSSSGSISQWFDLPSDDAEKARRIIHDAKPDILVYLDIGMRPIAYILASGRLAPIQMVLLGHPSTTGLTNVVRINAYSRARIVTHRCAHITLHLPQMYATRCVQQDACFIVTYQTRAWSAWSQLRICSPSISPYSPIDIRYVYH